MYRIKTFFQHVKGVVDRIECDYVQTVQGSSHLL